MAIMRTSLSMISFGFTIFSIFRALAENYAIGHAIPDKAPARFGLALVSLGVLLLAAGIVADILYMRTLRSQRQWLVGTGLVDGLAPLPRSLIVVSAILLLLIGLVAIGVILIRL